MFVAGIRGSSYPALGVNEQPRDVDDACADSGRDTVYHTVGAHVLGRNNDGDLYS